MSKRIVERPWGRRRKGGWVIRTDVDNLGEFETWASAKVVWGEYLENRQKPTISEQAKWLAIHGNVPINPTNAVRRQAEYKRNNSSDDDESGQCFK